MLIANVCNNLQQLHRIFLLYIAHNYATIMRKERSEKYATYNAYQRFAQYN